MCLVEVLWRMLIRCFVLNVWLCLCLSCIIVESSFWVGMSLLKVLVLLRYVL